MLTLRVNCLALHRNFCSLTETCIKTKKFELLDKFSSVCKEKLSYCNLVSFKYKYHFNLQNNNEYIQKDSLVTLEMYIRIPVKKMELSLN